LQALFLDSPARAAGQRFVIYHEPRGLARGCVVAVHPFGEEMNKSRRMSSLGARAIAGAGYAVLQVDLLGCGDSSGDLETARWDDWIDDVLLALNWLEQQHDAPQWLWGTRAGCLVAAAAAQRAGRSFDFLFWQPQASGKQVLQQFLRLKMASQLQRGTPKGPANKLQLDLAAGRSVDVAGYRLGPGLASGLAAATLLPCQGSRQLHWLEVTTREPAQLLPATAPVLDHWRGAGYDVRSVAVSGPPFWQTLDIEDAPELVQATLDALGASTAVVQ